MCRYKVLIHFVLLIFLMIVVPSRIRSNPLPLAPPCIPGGPVTKIATYPVCSGVTSIDIPVKVASFMNVGSISLKLGYNTAELGTAELLSGNASLWANFLVNTSDPGFVTVSGYGEDISLDDSATLFTLHFTAPSGLAGGTIYFIENAQGTFCEYAEGPSPYTPFCDTPAEDYYIPGGVVVDPPVTTFASKTDVLCYGTASGTATVSVSGGSSAYSYLWNNGLTSPTLTGLSAGIYSVTVTDGLNCSATADVEIIQPAEMLNAWISDFSHVTTYMGNDGSAAVGVSGGTTAYSYSWNSGQFAQSVSGLTAGVYMVTVTDAHSCTATASVEITQPDALCLEIRVFLQGPYNPATHLMKDDLRLHRYIPVTEPYSSAPYNIHFTHAGGGGGETITDTAAVFGVTGSNAIVDWVFIELRDKTDKTVRYTRSALLQRDGNVVDADGTGPVCFHGLNDYRFYVAVRHRNHLGVMTASVKNLTSAGIVIDFTNGSETEFNWGANHPVAGSQYNYTGLSQCTPESGKRAMWYGDANNDHKIVYDAFTDDLSDILSDVIYCSGNSTAQSGYDLCRGYFSGDLDMNGKVKYEAPNDDRSLILYQIMFYPLNTSHQSSFSNMLEQLP